MLKLKSNSIKAQIYQKHTTVIEAHESDMEQSENILTVG